MLGFAATPAITAQITIDFDVRSATDYPPLVFEGSFSFDPDTLSPAGYVRRDDVTAFTLQVTQTDDLLLQPVTYDLSLLSRFFAYVPDSTVTTNPLEYLEISVRPPEANLLGHEYALFDHLNRDNPVIFELRWHNRADPINDFEVTSEDGGTRAAIAHSSSYSTPTIEVSPVSYNFGNVQWGQTSTAMFTFSNTGGGDLTISEISLTDALGVFSITSYPSLYLLQTGESATAEVSFSPEAIQQYTGVLTIASSDPHEPMIEIPLSGTGVLADTPSDQMTAVIDYIDDAIASGELTGVGSGNSADKKVNALSSMINAAGDLLEGGQTDEGCDQIHAISLKVDGDPTPPDFVTGLATAGLANIIQELGAYYGCQP